MTQEEKIARMHQKNLKDWDEKKPWKVPEELRKTVFWWRKCTKCDEPIQIGRICPSCKAWRQRERYAQQKAKKGVIIIK